MKNGFRVAICVMMVVTVLAMSLSVFATDPSPSPTPELDEGLGAIQDEILSRYIWACLNAWGIHIKYQDMDGFYDEVESQILSWVMEYLASLPSAYTINQWVAPWQSGYDYWGNLMLNNSALEDIQEFAEWLIGEYDLQDNDSQVINPNYSYGAYNLYQTNKWYVVSPYGDYNVGVDDYGMLKITTPSDMLFMPVFYTNGLGFILFDNGQWNSSYEFLNTDDFNNVISTAAGSQGSYTSTPDGWYYNQISFPNNSSYTKTWYPSGGNYFVSTSNYMNWYLSDSDIRRYLNNSHIVQTGDTAIITTLIALPPDNPDYTSGDGITIIDGTPQYSDITFSGVIENLPAIVSTGTVTNPGLDTFWGFIPVLAEQTKDAIVLTRGLIYELPEELVVTFYAVMGGLILFGVIKLMREH